MNKECRNCKNGFKRSHFSFSRYGNYSHAYECALPENERTPYRRLDDTCIKWEKNGEQ